MDKIKDKRYKRTLFVGLGGEGIKTLRQLKKKIKEANDGKLPGQVKFLLIDTNATELANFRDFDCNEKVCIAVREPYQRYEYEKKNGDTHRYIPEKNAHSLKALERGAGQIRSNGHFAVIENQYSNKLIRIFREAADQIEDIDVNSDELERDPKIEVRMCFSIAGGTGSGTFLPIATLIRSAIRHCELTAYIYSATHFEKCVENSAKKSVMQNAYASILELDYMMHFGRNGLNYENVKFNFGPHETQQIEQSTRPFEEVYYIDKHTALPMPESIEFAYNERERLRETTAEAIHIATTNIITAHTGTVDNVRQKLLEGQFDVGDKFAWVSGFGIAELFLDQKNYDDERIVEAALKAISDSLKEPDEEKKKKIKNYAEDFVAQELKSDESKGDADGNQVLEGILATGDLDEYVKGQKPSSAYHTYTDNQKINLVSKYTSPESLIEERYKKIRVLIGDWINKNWKESNGEFIETNSGNKFSLLEVIEILKKIKECFETSKNTINQEYIVANTNFENKKKEYNKGPKEEPEEEGWFKRNAKKLFNVGKKKKNNTKQNEGVIDYSTLKETEYCEVVKCDLLAQRYKEVDTYFIGLIAKVDEEITKLETFKRALEEALKGRIENPSKPKNGVKIVDKNRVEVSNISVIDGFALSYKMIQDLANPQIFLDGGAKFREVCRLIVKEAGCLKRYLQTAKEEIEKLPEDRRNKDERTECQRNLERLIDLSAPSLQINTHGYGERVKMDCFWYLMTSFDSNDHNCDKEAHCSSNDESTGKLLKELIEPFLQGVKLNEVHVAGWGNKAILYRVDSAVPAYFVDGVCVGELGGNTLEGCYEELKKTRPHYTPFSHEMLRQKLENGLTVLRPHDNTLDEIALEHWVNFQLLSARLNPRFSINFQPCPKYAHRACTTMGYYSIVSDSLGKNLTASLDDRDNILILGKNRTDAYSMFTRYCKTLVDEYPEYREVIDQIQNDDYEEMFVMDGKQYMDIVLPKWTLLKFAEDDPERIQLKKEMDFMDKRKKDFDEKKRKSQKIDNVIDSHKDKPGQPGGGNPDDDNDDK